MLETGRPATVAYLLPVVLTTNSTLPPPVADALVARVRRADTGGVAELPVLAALGRVAPDRLVFDTCQRVDAWVPQGRAALADVLGGIRVEGEPRSQARFALLARLAGDGVFAVRRAAYRAAVKSDPQGWAEQIREWARGDEPLRRRAAEAAGWLSPDQAGEHLSELIRDPEPSVREAARQSLAARGKRASAESHLRHALGVENPSDIVHNWRYGVALSHVGDDATVEALDAAAKDASHPKVRFWLKRVRKAVQANWDKVTKKWPDPWYTRRGHLEEFRGTFRIDGGREVQLMGTLWSIPADSPNKLSSWGAWATGAYAHAGDEGELVIEGRCVTRAWVGSAEIPAGRLTLIAAGCYPDPV